MRRLTNPGTKMPAPRLLEYIGFEIAPFGIDFRSNCWYFFSPRMQAGRFTPTIRESRWRSTNVVTLEYGVSKLPRRMRNFLYDEIKPISETLCLGLGGINAEKDAGDHFYFVLERIT